MARFESSTIVRRPIDQVLQALRDDLPRLAQHMDDVERIETIEREQLDDDRLMLVNVWHARPVVGPPLNQFIDPNMLRWTDRAIWDGDGTGCEFRIEPHFMRDEIHCTGSTRLEEAMRGRGTKIRCQGELRITRIPGVPEMLAKTVRERIETFVAEMVGGNITKLGAALTKARNGPRAGQSG